MSRLEEVGDEPLCERGRDVAAAAGHPARGRELAHLRRRTVAAEADSAARPAPPVACRAGNTPPASPPPHARDRGTLRRRGCGLALPGSGSRDRPPARDGDDQQDLRAKDDPVEVDRRDPGDILTLDDDGAGRPRIEADPSAARRGGVLTSTAAAADFQRRDHGDAVLLIWLAKNRRPRHELSDLVQDLHFLTSYAASRFSTATCSASGPPPAPGTSRMKGSFASRGSCRRARKPCSPIWPVPMFAWRSRLEPSPVTESLQWITSMRESPTTRSSSSMVFFTSGVVRSS